MRTKIIATAGPASCSRDSLARLAEAGVSVFRLNFSHGDPEFFRQVVGRIRSVEAQLGRPLTVLQDLAGPKIRIGHLAGDSLQVLKGNELILGTNTLPGDSLPLIPFDHQDIIAGLVAGDRLVLADGGLQFQVCGRPADGQVLLKALGSGLITSRKGLAIPGKSLPLPALTDKDRKDLAQGLELGVDAVALSFVQTADDIRAAKELMRNLGRVLPVVAKLERQNAVECLDDILAETDVVMVARGDLGVECPLSALPAMQKRIIRACNRAAKPVIVATQMLLSMVSSPVPTRAETTDVANAVLDGADCLMLSEETAMGNYPVECVAQMRQIALEAERFQQEDRQCCAPDMRSSQFLAHAACLLAEKPGVCALAAHTASGFSARLLSACRPPRPIHALTTNPTVLHALNFSWGVLPHLINDDPNSSHLHRVQRFVDNRPEFVSGSDVVITAGEPTPGQPQPGTNLVKIYRK